MSKDVKMAKEFGWSIAGSCGLYIGWWQRRIDAIAAHTSHLHGTSPYHYGHLSTDQLSSWAKCKKNGDYVVRVEIKYDRRIKASTAQRMPSERLEGKGSMVSLRAAPDSMKAQ